MGTRARPAAGEGRLAEDPGEDREGPARVAIRQPGGRSAIAAVTEQVRHATEAATADPAEREPAFAKVNLALHVTGRRDDGYHLLETLAVFTEFGDMLTAVRTSAETTSLEVSGPFGGAIGPGNNLVFRAAAGLLQESAEYGRPAARMALTKNIPVAAGLGGGSADAAATLRLLARLWDIRFDAAKLTATAAKIGADVPMCLSSRPLIARGAGEQIEAVPGFPSLPMVLVHPGEPVLTAQVFAALANRTGAPLPPLPARFNDAGDVVGWLEATRNDLAEPAECVNAIAGSAAKALANDANCLFARMSGSGAAAFGIFMSRQAAERGVARLRAANPPFWAVATVTRPSPEGMVTA